MCLLVVCSRIVAGIPLVIAANRDELLDRPATSMTVLQETSPVILGGRDEKAGGTWLAVNECGVVAGVTNRPSPSARDPNRRSRGELPLLLAAEATASAAVAAFSTGVEPSCYNPAWLLVGDRLSLFYIELGGVEPRRCSSHFLRASIFSRTSRSGRRRARSTVPGNCSETPRCCRTISSSSVSLPCSRTMKSRPTGERIVHRPAIPRLSSSGLCPW